MSSMEGAELTDAELGAIEARCAAATPGPWRSWIEGRDHTSGDSVITSRAHDIYLSPPPSHAAPHDQDFIAAARQDIPRLIAEVRRLRRLLHESADHMTVEDAGEIAAPVPDRHYLAPRR